MSDPRELQISQTFLKHFEGLEDPRYEKMCDHLLVDILVIAILAVICGAGGWAEMAAFGQSKRTFLASFLQLPNGIPSDDTFQRVFARLKPRSFEACFRQWMACLQEQTEGRLIAVDGKTVRGVLKRSLLGLPLHMVHAWSVGNRLLLGQLATDVKSNEITAIPELLKLLDLTGAVVTIDAMGCQTEIVNTIVEKGGHYIVAVKGNQPTLHEAVKTQFDPATRAPTSVAIDDTTGNGRVERRRIVTTPAPAGPETARWKALKTFICVESERTKGGTTTYEHRYYITDLPHGDAKLLGSGIRGHWSVENSLHWQLDVAFREDDSQVSAGHGAENLSLLNKLALTLIRREKTRKNGIAVSRKRAGWDDDYLLKVLVSGTTE